MPSYRCGRQRAAENATLMCCDDRTLLAGTRVMPSGMLWIERRTFRLAKWIEITMPSKFSRPRASIRLAQNFLKDPSLVADLVSRTDLSADDLVYEVGPGRGIITRVLARVCRKVVAIELQPDLADILRRQFGDCETVEVVTSDILEFGFPAVPYKVFSNIPFNITAEILRALLYGKHTPVRAYLIMQREAAEKYCGETRVSQASALLAPWYNIRIMHRFNRTDFDPVPSVEVVLLDIWKRECPLVSVSDAEMYRSFITYGFGRQRANLGKSFKKIFSHLQWKILANDLGFDVHAQPTDLTFDQWRGAFQFFQEGVKSGFVKVPREMSGSTQSAVGLASVARVRTNSVAQRWKHRKAKQSR